MAVFILKVSQVSQQDQKQQNPVAENGDCLFRPRYKSVAAIAGWDEGAILVAALVVEDTPDRLCKHKKRTGLQFKESCFDSDSVLDLDEEQISEGESEQTKEEVKNVADEEKRTEEEKKTAGDELIIEKKSGVSLKSCSLFFCKKCLRFAADKCGRRIPMRAWKLKAAKLGYFTQLAPQVQLESLLPLSFTSLLRL
ncbi:hypothetical protein Q3G72_016430 [Acer saccharum]|nr:hypothetical protein Q3G72_016430 [Acer saccharum]